MWLLLSSSFQAKEPVPKKAKKSKVSKELVHELPQFNFFSFSFLTLQVAAVVGDLGAEKRKNLDILASIAKKRAVLDTQKAVNQHLATEQRR